MRILLAYDSLSGNTKMVADEITDELQALGHEVTAFRVSEGANYPLNESYDLYILGAWTVDYGRTPPDMKDFIFELGKPSHVALFGTGETQWGVEHFCGAVDRMQKYFSSTYPTLKIEQMPHTEKDRQEIKEYVQQVLDKRSETL
ncbi:flavodoxin [Listeria fleischmannii]|uniref:Flavodoxin n=2 Tax=Listeria fleischmannii TaxID=1069827 RepID=A0A2X3H4S2_9LIST|nr:flavodoxin [Listeria fleischmannii]EMG28672.1 flavodoxin [Listeria fleischmannii subsp. fleischmannii LU2006-1]SQC67467.1 Flavodoxin [Listeria fleischmannii subsp. fleischmannii]